MAVSRGLHRTERINDLSLTHRRYPLNRPREDGLEKSLPLSHVKDFISALLPIDDLIYR